MTTIKDHRRAYYALNTYQDGEQTSQSEAVTDLIADLLLLAESEGEDPAAILRMAQDHYNNERATTSTHQMGGQAAPAEAQYTPRHTPGPWIVEKYHDGTQNIFGGGIHIACVPQEDGFGYPDTPNARLIAAAPDMLEALGKVRACLASTSGAIPCDPHNPEFIQYVDDICRAAIAKATH